jgi:hypothetical protein
MYQILFPLPPQKLGRALAVRETAALQAYNGNEKIRSELQGHHAPQVETDRQTRSGNIYKNILEKRPIRHSNLDQTSTFDIPTTKAAT